jgi:hypothetical protein
MNYMSLVPELHMPYAIVAGKAQISRVLKFGTGAPPSHNVGPHAPHPAKGFSTRSPSRGFWKIFFFFSSYLYFEHTLL